MDATWEYEDEPAMVAFNEDSANHTLPHKFYPPITKCAQRIFEHEEQSNDIPPEENSPPTQDPPNARHTPHTDIIYHSDEENDYLDIPSLKKD